MRNQFSLFQSPLDLAHGYWKQVVKKGDIVVDATCGNGHDTLLLANLVGSAGSIIACDVQSQAVQSTTEYLSANLQKSDTPKIEFALGCHSRFPEQINLGSVRLVVYNLGYLPRGDKALITKTETTLKSLSHAMEIVMPGGVISISCYPGHEGGDKEEQAIISFAESLSKEVWSCCYHRWLNRKNSPTLILLQKGLLA